MSKENFQITETPPTKTKEIFQNLVSLILPKQLSFDEQVKALQEQRQEKIKNIVNTPVNNTIKEKPKNLKKTGT